MRSLILTAFVIGATVIAGCGSSASTETASAPEVTIDTLVNPDDEVTIGTQVNSDDVVTIGTQVWMGKNLDVSTFRNGDPIPEAKTADEWREAGENGQPAWSYYNNDPANGARYGKLYNWYAVNDSRGLAPEGWHIPTYAEWNTLENYLGNDDRNKMKSTSGWRDNGNGTNSSGFSGLPGGYRNNDGTFKYIGYNGGWWSSTEFFTLSDETFGAWGRFLSYYNGNVYRNFNDKRYGLSVRCLMD